MDKRTIRNGKRLRYDEYGPNAHVDFVIHYRELKLKEMPIKANDLFRTKKVSGFKMDCFDYFKEYKWDLCAPDLPDDAEVLFTTVIFKK